MEMMVGKETGISLSRSQRTVSLFRRKTIGYLKLQIILLAVDDLHALHILLILIRLLGPCGVGLAVEFHVPGEPVMEDIAEDLGYVSVFLR